MRQTTLILFFQFIYKKIFLHVFLPLYSLTFSLYFYLNVHSKQTHDKRDTNCDGICILRLVSGEIVTRKFGGKYYLTFLLIITTRMV